MLSKFYLMDKGQRLSKSCVIHIASVCLNSLGMCVCPFWKIIKIIETLHKNMKKLDGKWGISTNNS